MMRTGMITMFRMMVEENCMKHRDDEEDDE